MKLCQNCERGHKLIKATRSHKLVDMNSCRADRCRKMLKVLEKEKKEFIGQVEKTAVEIREKAEQLKRMISEHKEKLVFELSSVKEKRMKKIESLRKDIERQMMSMESYKNKNVDEVKQKGTACDIARAASGLHDRADKLMSFDVIERTLADMGHADVTFTSSDFVIDDVNKTLGHLRLNSVTSGKIVNRNTYKVGSCRKYSQ